MSTVAFRRAHRLLDLVRAKALGARALAVLDALLVLALLGLAGLLLALVDSRGRVVVPRGQPIPAWKTAELPFDDSSVAAHLVENSGLFPVVAQNRTPASPWVHRRASVALSSLIERIRPLRGNRSSLMMLLAIGLGLLLARTLVGGLRRSWAAESANAAAATLRRQVHRHMYRLGRSSLPDEGTNPIVNLFTREVNDVRDGLFADLLHAWFVPTVAVGLALIALFVAPVPAVFLIALGGLVWLVSRPMNKLARRDSDLAARNAAMHLALLHEDLGMLRTVRVYGMEGIDKQRFDEHLDRYNQAEVRRLRIEGGGNPTTWLLLGAAVIVGLGLLGFAVLQGQLSAAAAIVVLIALAGLTRPLVLWRAWRREVRLAGRSASALFDFLEMKPELQQAVKARFLAPLKERISFENVTLDGPDSRPLLSGVSLDIPARTRTAVLGLDDASKHALACLVPRLIDPTSGRVRMDGTDLRDVTLESLRAQVATVLQDDLVFSDSVAANIGLSDPSFTLPRIIEAAKVAHVHYVIQELPHGYDTVIGPLGHYLKPDEQYRIALARAYLHDPSIVLIEEPDVKLDDDTKHLIDDTIDRLAQDRTLIFLPHRLSTIRKCDQIAVLHNGSLEAAGPPGEVQSRSKLYRHIQYIEFSPFGTGEVEAGQMNGG